MRQSSIIFGTLVAAFVIYVTVRGQLPEYLSLFTGGTSSPAPGNSSTGATGDWDAKDIFEKFDEQMSTMGLKN